MTMHCAIVATYKISDCIVSRTLFTTAAGVRQGPQTPCLVFLLHVSYLIGMIKQNCGWDGFLGLLHVLL